MALLFRLLLAPFRLAGRSARWWWGSGTPRGAAGRPPWLLATAARLTAAAAFLGAVGLFGVAAWAMFSGETQSVALAGGLGTGIAGVGAALWTWR